MTLEEKIEDAREWKNTLAKVWLGSTAGAAMLGVYGYINNELSIIGTVFAYWMIISIGFIAFFSIFDDREEDLKEEKRKDDLEDRISRLEEEVL